MISCLNLFHSGYQLTGTLANSEDPDEMPHQVAFHPGLHFLLRAVQVMLRKTSQFKVKNPQGGAIFGH